MESCKIDTIQSTAKSSPNGALLVFTQAGCPHCPPFLKAATDAIGNKVKIITAPVEKTECGSLADKYKVTRTPSAIYFDSTGKEKKRIPIENKTWTQVKQGLVKLVTPHEVQSSHSKIGAKVRKHSAGRQHTRKVLRQHTHPA